MTNPTPHVQLRDNITPEAEEAIRRYWRRCELGNRRDGSIHKEFPNDNGRDAATMYLQETDRLTEKELLQDLHAPLAMAARQMESVQARQADGDLTIWSDPPKTWLKERDD